MENNNRVEKAYLDSASAEIFAEKYINYLCEILNSIDKKSIANFIEVIIAARESGSHIYFIGNLTY